MCESYERETRQYGKTDLVSAVIVSLLLMISYYAMGKYFYILGESLTNAVFYLIEILQVLFVFVLIFFLCRIRHQSFLENCGFKNNWKSSLLWGLFFSVIIFLVFGQMAGFQANNSFPAAVERLGYYLFVIAFPEEFAWRGYIGKRFYGAIAASEKSAFGRVLLFRKAAAVFLVGILFSLVHVPFQAAIRGSGMLDYLAANWGNLLVILLMHIFFQWLYAKYNNITMPWLIHCFWDFSQNLFF